MAETPPIVKVLLIDDDRQEFVLLVGLLSLITQARFQLEWASEFADGLERLKGERFDVCLVDYRLQGDKTGVDLLKAAKAAGVATPMILLTGLWDTKIDIEAMKLGAADYLVKGQFGPELLERSLRYAVERARAVAALRDSEELYRALVEGTGAAVVLMTPEGRLERLNELAAAAFTSKIKELDGLAHGESDRAALKAAVKRALSEKRPVQIEFRAAGAAPRWFFGVAAPVSAAGKDLATLIVRDVTERKELETRYLQAEKMSAMGFLAAGVARELSTPLNVILGNLTIMNDLDSNKKLRKPLESMDRAIGRCRGLIDSLLAFARKDDDTPREFSLEEAIGGALQLVSPAARAKIVDIRHEFKDAPVVVMGHRNRFEQVLINLANNALDAMNAGGRLVFRTCVVKDNGAKWARVEVADNGRGIPKELLTKVTEPFFTTKKEGRGTGLGLSLASEIVAKHGGRLEIDSTVGKGTTVIVTLPCSR